MKHLRLGKGLIVLAVVLMLSSFGVHKLCKAIFSVTDIHWQFDEQLSDLAQKSIIRFGQECCHDNFLLFVDQLKQQFPVIKDVTLHHINPGQVKVTVEGVTPKARVNEKWVVSEDGREIEAYFFQEHIVNALPYTTQLGGAQARELECPDCSRRQRKCCEIDPLFTAWITETPSQLFTKYHVKWIDQFHIRLQDREQKSFFLQIAAETELREYIVHVTEKIKLSLIDRGYFLRTAYDWIADLRFRDHVIVFREQRGIKHGTNTG
jgi:hypothetical protein